MKRTPRISKSLSAAVLVLSGVIPMTATAVGAATAPTAPLAVSAVVSGTSVAVTWSAPTSDGGSAITGYRAVALPGGKSCTTVTETACTITGLKAGAEYAIIVRAQNAVDFGDAESVDVTTDLLTAAAGKSIAVTKAPAANIAGSVAIAVKGRTVTVGALAPSRAVRYTVGLHTPAGAKIAVASVTAKPGNAAKIKVTAKAAGRYKVVLTVSRSNGTSSNWNGPVVAVK